MKFLDLVSYATYLSPIILFIGIIIGAYCFKNLDRIGKILIFYLLSMFSIDVLSRIIGEVYGNNLFFIPILGFLELFIFSMLYYFLAGREEKLKRYSLIVINAATLIFTIWEIQKIADTPLSEFESYSKAIATLIIVLFSISFFLEKIWLRKDISGALFFLNSGILLFYSLELIIFLPIDFLIHDNTGLKFYFWFANLIFILIFYVFIIASIWKNGKTQE